MSETEWRPFSYDDKAATKPADSALVWVMEEFYEGVTVGYFDGFTFRVWSGSDDCSVTHWAPITYPGAPVSAPGTDVPGA
jgi:hypothetical protein